LIRKFLLLKFSKNKEFYQKIFNVLGFYPSKLSLYKIALTHNSSHQNYDKKEKRVNNERLEYLGDSVLGMVIAEKLYLKFPYKDEGFLTEMRSKIVGRNKLNAIGKKMGVIGLLQYDKKLHSNQNIIDTLCGNALEAIIGAMYLDKGFRFTKIIYQPNNPRTTH
jgi:ribonuclease III